MIYFLEPKFVMQSFVRSKLVSTLPRINSVAEKYNVRYKSFKESVAKVVPKKPKKPESALDRYLKEVEPQIKAENPNYTPQEMKAIVREMWNELNATEKLPFRSVAKQENEEYNEACRLYACNLTDEESAATLLKSERRMRSGKLRILNRKLMETGKPQKPVPAFGFFAADQRAEGCYEPSSEMNYYETIKRKWSQLPEEKKLEYKLRAQKEMKIYNEQLSEWAKHIVEPFSKWVDIHGIATAEKTMTDFKRPVKPPTALSLFIDKMKSENDCEMIVDMQHYLSKWIKLKKDEKETYFAEAKMLHDDYEKKLEEWNKKMNESLGSWASKVRPESS